MTIEQLRREVAREVSAAIAVGEAKGAPAISYALESRRVRAAFDAYDKAVIAAHKPTFEGDEAEVRRRLQDITTDYPHTGTGKTARKALALLDAKDAEKDSLATDLSLLMGDRDRAEAERDAALSRAEQAEAALAERDAAIAEVVRWLERAPLESGICCCGDPIEGHGYYNGHSPVDGLAYSARQLADTLRPFLPAKPAADLLVELAAIGSTVFYSHPDLGHSHKATVTAHVEGWLELEFNDRSRATVRPSHVHGAAIERAGGVKAVFGEGL